MTNESFANDDDIFSYDPSTEKIVNQPDFSSSASNKSTGDIFEDISKRIEQTKDDDILGSFSMKVRFAESLLSSYTHFVRFNQVFFHKAVHQTLDQLTSGRFSMLYMFNYLEQNIIRRLNINYLLSNIFTEKDDNVIRASEDFKLFMKKVQVDLDDTFISCYIETNLEINNHVLNNERSMYAHLAEKLELEMHPAISDPQPSVQTLLDSFSENITEHHQVLTESMYASLLDSDYLNKVSHLYSSPVRLTQI